MEVYPDGYANVGRPIQDGQRRDGQTQTGAFLKLSQQILPLTTTGIDGAMPPPNRHDSSTSSTSMTVPSGQPSSSSSHPSYSSSTPAPYDPSSNADSMATQTQRPSGSDSVTIQTQSSPHAQRPSMTETRSSSFGGKEDVVPVGFDESVLRGLCELDVGNENQHGVR